jgi:hypothetical protein
MGQRDVPAGDAPRPGQGRRLPGDRQRRGAAFAPDDLHVGEVEGSEPDRQRLHHRLLGGEAGGQAGDGVVPIGRLGPFGGGEDTFGEPGPPPEHGAEPLDVDGVDPDPDHFASRNHLLVLAEERAECRDAPSRP